MALHNVTLTDQSGVFIDSTQPHLRHVFHVHVAVRELAREPRREPARDGEDVRDAATVQALPVVRGAYGAEQEGH